LFCRQCIITASTFKSECPVCRKQIQAREIHSSAYLQRMVDDMRVRCLYRGVAVDSNGNGNGNGNGCEWQGRRGDIARHLTDCPHVPVPCRLCRQKQKRSLLAEHEQRLCIRREVTCDHCHMTMTAERMGEHRTQCAALPIPCPNDCNTVALLPRGQLAAHLMNVCPLAASPCPFGRWGCEFGGKKGTLTAHLTDTTVMSSHLSLLEQQCVRTNTALADAEMRERRRDDIIQQQQTTINILQQQVTQLLALQASSLSQPSSSLSSSSSSSSSRNGLHLVSTPHAARTPSASPPLSSASRSVSNGSISTSGGSSNNNNGSGANTVTYVTQLQSPISERKIVAETPKRGTIPSVSLPLSSNHNNTNNVYVMTPHSSRAPPLSTRLERKNHHLKLKVGLFFDIQGIPISSLMSLSHDCSTLVQLIYVCVPVANRCVWQMVRSGDYSSDE
jgi:hypothetical protein